MPIIGTPSSIRVSSLRIVAYLISEIAVPGGGHELQPDQIATFAGIEVLSVDLPDASFLKKRPGLDRGVR